MKPGEKVNLEVWGKYFTPTATNSSVVTNIAAAITSAFGVSPASTGEGASAYQALNALFATGPVIGAGQWENAGAPKAYLNYILFDQNYVAYDMGWDQINTSAEATVANPNPPHDYMALTANVTKAGYLYVYLSNESAQITDVFFDDLRITHVQNAGVVQAENYYMFGMAFQEYQKEGSVANPFKFGDKEEQDEMGLGWMDHGARMYDPAIGRWISMDPLAEKSRRFSPYNFVMNNPLTFIDPDGMISEDGQRWLQLQQWKNEDDKEYGNNTLESNTQNPKSESKYREVGENDASDEGGDPVTTFSVLHSDNLDGSFGWDWFLESVSTQVNNVTNVTVQTAVIIIYNMDKKDWGTPKYGQVIEIIGRTRSITQDEYGNVTTKNLSFDLKSVSSNMKDWIRSAKDYHCGGCLTEPSVVRKYFDFILSPNEKPRKNRLNAGGHRENTYMYKENMKKADERMKKNKNKIPKTTIDLDR